MPGPRALLAAVACAGGCRSPSAPPRDELRPTALEHHLLHPPATSQARVKAAQEAPPPPTLTDDERSAIDSTRRTVEGLLQPVAQPPATAVFVPLSAEVSPRGDSSSDVIRTRYATDHGEIELGSSLCVVSLSLARAPTTSCQARAQQLADQLLRLPWPVTLRRLGGSDEDAHGDARSRNADGTWSEHSLHWWCEREQVGFTMLIDVAEDLHPEMLGRQLVIWFETAGDQKWFRADRARGKGPDSPGR